MPSDALWMSSQREASPEVYCMDIDANNAWRTETPGAAGWTRTARPDDPRKYLMISADCHANEPATLWAERMDAKYRDRLPRVEQRGEGAVFQVTDGFRPMRLQNVVYEGEDDERNKSGRTPEGR